MSIHADPPVLRRCATLPDARPVPSLTSTSSTEEENLTGCTPALRRRRQSEKYVTDASQLNLRFQRPQRRTRPNSEVLPRYYPRGVPSYLLDSGKRNDESSDNDSDSSGPPNTQPPPPPSSLPPHVAENNARYDFFLIFIFELFAYSLLLSLIYLIQISSLYLFRVFIYFSLPTDAVDSDQSQKQQ